MHSTHFNYGYMVKYHSDSERGNPLPPHRLLFPISSNGFLLYASSHRQDNTHHNLCYTSGGALAGTNTCNNVRNRYIHKADLDTKCGECQIICGQGRKTTQRVLERKNALRI